MLGKVREVIHENESLHEKQKRDALTSMIQHLDGKTDGGSKSPGGRRSGTPKVIVDSRITELEAQLQQAKRDLRNAEAELTNVRKFNEDDCSGGLRYVSKSNGTVSSTNPTNNPYINCDLHRAEISTLSQ